MLFDPSKITQFHNPISKLPAGLTDPLAVIKNCKSDLRDSKSSTFKTLIWSSTFQIQINTRGVPIVKLAIIIISTTDMAKIAILVIGELILLK